MTNGFPILFYNEGVQPGEVWLQQLQQQADAMSDLSFYRLAKLYDSAIYFYLMLGKNDRVVALCHHIITQFTNLSSQYGDRLQAYCVNPWVALMRIDCQQGRINDVREKLSKLHRFAQSKSGDVQRKARLAYIKESASLAVVLGDGEELTNFLHTHLAELYHLHPHLYRELSLYLKIYHPEQEVISYASLSEDDVVELGAHPKKFNLSLLYAEWLFKQGCPKRAYELLYCSLKLMIANNDELRQAAVLVKLYEHIVEAQGRHIIEDFMINLYARTHFKLVRLIMLLVYRELEYVERQQSHLTCDKLYDRLLT